VVRDSLEILHDGGEVELVARAGETHALETVVNLQVETFVVGVE
jgi:hypothetical protein